MLKTIAGSIKSQISNQVLNQEALTELSLAAFFAGGHILLTGPTGLGKTLWACSIADALGLSRNCIRFAEDIYPPEILDAHTHSPDAYNPEPHQVAPYFMIATTGSYQALSPKLTDRFMMLLSVNYPGVAAEKQILQMHHVNAQNTAALAPVCTPEAIAQAIQEVKAVAADESVFNYIISIVETTRRVSAVQSGASPRGSIALLMAAKAYAAIGGRDYVTTDDVRGLAIPVLRHRLSLRPDAISEGIQPDRIIDSIIAGIAVPI